MWVRERVDKGDIHILAEVSVYLEVLLTKTDLIGKKQY